MATDTHLIDIDALVYDAYGTLFDVHSVIALAEQLVSGQGLALSQLWRSKQLEYTWLQSLMQTPTYRRDDFAAVTRHALDYALDALHLEFSPGQRQQLFDAYLVLATFPDVPMAMAALAPRRQLILSNGTLGMLAPLVRHTGLDRHLTAILSVDAADVYKPSPRVYQLAVEKLQLSPARIGFVSSNCWDAIGAKAFGFTTFWINRAGAPVDRHGPAPDRIIATLGELPALLL